MGADIIRRQLSFNGGQTTIDEENWDPWKTDSDVGETTAASRGITNTLRDRIIDYSHKEQSSKQSSKQAPKQSSQSKPNSNSQRAHEILSAGDNYFIKKENSTAALATVTACAPFDAAMPKNESSGEQPQQPNTQAQQKQNRTNPFSDMVQRVSDMDTSTFSSSTENGYLPKNLLPSFCGALNTTIGNCSNPQLTNNPIYNNNNNANTQPLPNVPIPAKTKNADRSPAAEEQLETSTLDFLANLHVKEEDLNFVFTNLENEQAKLCARSGIPAQCIEHYSDGCTVSELTTSSYVTAAATPFEKMVSPKSSFHDQLLRDPAYKHALQAGTLWQSLCSQHVRFPAHWWDGQEPVGPPLGSLKKKTKPWAYLGRHRIQGDYKLTKLIGNRASSGRILLHLVVRDALSGEPIEDIACGCFHPNARGVRTTNRFDPSLEDCRDVWIAHRRRVVHEVDIDGDEEDDNNNKFSWTTIESLLKHQNKGRVHLSPLGAQGGKHSVNNENLRAVFGSKPPIYTVFCMESELYELFQSKLDGTIPASVALLRHYLGYQQMK